MARDTNMRDIGLLPERKKPTNVLGRQRRSCPTKYSNIVAQTTRKSIELENGHRISLQQLHPYGIPALVVEPRDTQLDYDMDVSGVDSRSSAATPHTQQKLPSHDVPLKSQLPTGLLDLAATRRFNGLCQAPQSSSKQIASTPPALSSFEEFMEQIERSSPAPPPASSKNHVPSQSSSVGGQVMPHTDSMHQNSDQAHFGPIGCTVLRRDTDLNNGNVITPTVSVRYEW